VTATVLLVAHGSRDPAAAATVGALAGLVAAGSDLPVRAAYLDHTPPHPGQVLAGLAAAGCPATVVVPLLLTHAHHGRVDLPAALAGRRGLGLRVAVTDGLGPVDGRVPPQLVAGLRRRWREATSGGPAPDAMVLAAAGTACAAARGTVAQAARALAATLDLPCWVGYASSAAPTAGEAVLASRAAGARRVAVAAYFLAPGRLYSRAVASARDVGAVTVAAPLGAAVELADLILARIGVVVPAARPPVVAAGRSGREKGL
jgi:sirohydrochlorin ferrochelatase